MRTLAKYKRPVESIVMSAGGRLLSTGETNEDVKVWNVMTGKVEKSLKRYSETYDYLDGGSERASLNDKVSCLQTFSGEGLLSVTSTEMKIGNILTGKYTTIQRSHTQEITSLVALPDKKAVSGSANGTIRVWDLDLARLYANRERDPRILSGRQDSIYSLAVSPDGRFVSGSREGKIKL